MCRMIVWFRTIVLTEIGEAVEVVKPVAASEVVCLAKTRSEAEEPSWFMAPSLKCAVILKCRLNDTVWVLDLCLLHGSFGQEDVHAA